MFAYPCYYVNLDRSHMRNDRFLNGPVPNYFKRLIRISAVDGNNLNLDNEQLTKNGRDSILKHFRTNEELGVIGALGCYLSHICVWKLFLASDSEYCTVFEDDANVNENQCKLINVALSEMSYVNPDLLLLNVNNSIVEHEYSNKVKSFFYTHSYIISKRCAQIFVKHAFPAEFQIDKYMVDTMIKYNLNVYNMKNIEIKQFPAYGFSDIGHWKIHLQKYKYNLIFGLYIILNSLYLLYMYNYIKYIYKKYS